MAIQAVGRPSHHTPAQARRAHLWAAAHACCARSALITSISSRAK